MSEPANVAEPPAKLASSEFKKFLQLSSAFIKSGQKAGAELPQEHQAVSGSKLKQVTLQEGSAAVLPATDSWLTGYRPSLQAIHAFDRAAHAVELRQSRLQHEARLAAKARMEQLPMEKLHWGRKYLSHEYGDNWNVYGGRREYAVFMRSCGLGRRHTSREDRYSTALASVLGTA